MSCSYRQTFDDSSGTDLILLGRLHLNLALIIFGKLYASHQDQMQSFEMRCFAAQVLTRKRNYMNQSSNISLYLHSYNPGLITWMA